MSEASGVEAEGGRPAIRVFLLDDHEVVRRGLRDLLEAETDIEVIGEAGTAESGMNRMLVLRPDVGLLDVRLPDGDGVRVCRDIRSALPGTACLMLTACQRAEGTHQQEVLLQAAVVVGEPVRGLDHGIRGGEASVVV